MQEYPTEQQKIRKTRDEIIRDYFKKGMSMAALGRKYRLSRERVRQIIRLSTPQS